LQSLARALDNYQKPEDLIGENGLLKRLVKMLVKRALEVGMTNHLGLPKPSRAISARCRWTFPVTAKGHASRKSSSSTRPAGPASTTKSSRGLSVREIQGHLGEMYGTEVSPTLISNVTDAVSEDVKPWQARPLDADPVSRLYPRQGARQRRGAHQAVYLAIGVNMEGHKEVLGLWIYQTEGAMFWLQVVIERAGHRHRLRRRPERLPGRHQGGLPTHRRPFNCASCTWYAIA
jgi:putative transposase